MAVPWLTLIDTLIDVAGVAISRKTQRRVKAADASALREAPDGTLGRLETRLAGVMVAALKEAFDRDASRLEFERDQAERERERAERLLKLDLLRQAGDRELGRLRLMAGVAVGSWIGTLLFSTRLIGGPIGARIMLGGGWLLLLAALALSFAAQSRVSRALATLDEPVGRHDRLSAGAAGAAVPWLIVFGLAVIGLAVLVA
jgi:hypothetical protein